MGRKKKWTDRPVEHRAVAATRALVCIGSYATPAQGSPLRAKLSSVWCGHCRIGGGAGAQGQKALDPSKVARTRTQKRRTGPSCESPGQGDDHARPGQAGSCIRRETDVHMYIRGATEVHRGAYTRSNGPVWQHELAVLHVARGRRLSGPMAPWTWRRLLAAAAATLGAIAAVVRSRQPECLAGGQRSEGPAPNCRRAGDPLTRP